MESVKEADLKDVEQGVLDAYMDVEQAANDAPTDEEHVVYLKMRYMEIRRDYKLLQLQKTELEKTDRTTDLPKVQEAFKQNYLVRKYVVRELRKSGEKVDDPFIMG